MNPVQAAEIKSLEDYRLSRDDFRKRMLAVKSPRRVRVGEHITVLFENHDTVLYQIQEMLRVEGITEPKAIAHEIATYNELIGGPGELKATLLIEYEDAEQRDRRLRELRGLEDHLRLRLAGAGDIVAEFDTRQIAADRISAVHYLRFDLGEGAAAAIRDGAAIELVVDHPQLTSSTQLTLDQRAALAEDLSV